MVAGKKIKVETIHGACETCFLITSVANQELSIEERMQASRLALENLNTQMVQ